jgi:hypothetical protein
MTNKPQMTMSKSQTRSNAYRVECFEPLGN